jgi:hypothetical protein
MMTLGMTNQLNSLLTGQTVYKKLESHSYTLKDHYLAAAQYV